MAKKKSSKAHKHVEGDHCYECGFGVKSVSWKCIVIAVIIGVAFGVFLAGGNLTSEDVLKYLTLILITVILGLVLDTRKLILNHYFLNGKK